MKPSCASYNDKHNAQALASCPQCRLSIQACQCSSLFHNQLNELPVQIELCTHSQEWQKDTNTGNWLDLQSPQICRHRWHRKEPQIPPANAVLLYPADDAIELAEYAKHHPIDALWVIDASWQLSHKMIKQSPWLQSMPKVMLNIEKLPASQYQLRRNQQSLCTYESVLYALQTLSSNNALLQSMRDIFHTMQQQYLKSKQSN